MVAGRVVKVLPDEPAIDREFDYALPAGLPGADDLTVGSVVRVDLRRRRVRGWVTAVDVAPAADVELAPIRKVSGHGPPAALLDLAAWAARRWVGRRPHFLRTATSDRVVTDLPGERGWRPVPSNTDPLAEDAVAAGQAVVRLPPGADDWPLVLAAARQGRTLVLVPSVDRARHLALRLDRAGVDVARYPDEWAAATSARVTVGARAAAWAPCGPLDAVLVLDEHDEAFQEEAAPTWHARDVAVERARRDGAACLLTSAAPSLAALSLGWPVLRPSRAAERAGWPVLDVVDRRRDDPMLSSDWCSPALARLLERGGQVVAILNRKDRAAMVACRQCGTLAVGADERPLVLRKDRLVDRATGEQRPVVCAECGSTAFRRLRVGTEGVRNELQRLARRPGGRDHRRER